MYNPYITAFHALTNSEARRFYADTAIEHTFLTVAVAGIAINNTIEAGKSFRQVHDSHIVPFTLLAIATVVEFFATPEPNEPEPSQPLLPGFTPTALLPEAKPQERVLVTPCTSSDRTLISPVVEESDEAQEFIDRLKDATPAPQLLSFPAKPAPVGHTMPEPYSDHSYKELQAACKERGLLAKGTREQLVSRLCKADIEAAPIAWRSYKSIRVRGWSIE